LTGFFTALLKTKAKERGNLLPRRRKTRGLQFRTMQPRRDLSRLPSELRMRIRELFKHLK